jgi:DNA-binding protein H-NS
LNGVVWFHHFAVRAKSKDPYLKRGPAGAAPKHRAGEGRLDALTKETPLMSKTYAQVMKQIDSLKAEAEKLRKKEVDGVVGRIREAIAHYGLTAADLGLTSTTTTRRASVARKAGKAAPRRASTQPPRFRDENGRVWGGRGPRPKWLREALVAGRKLEEFAVS